MKPPNPPRSVLGVSAPRTRPTLSGAFWLATLVSLPAGLAIGAVDLFLRWLF